MATIIYDSESDHLVCQCCGQGWDESDLAECDECGGTVCDDCQAIMEADCPADFCKWCSENAAQGE